MENNEVIQDYPFGIDDQVERLNRIGIALTLEHDLQKLLELIVKESRALTHADAGSLYLVQNGRLFFTVAQNETLNQRLGSQENVQVSFQKIELELTRESLAGYVASTGETLNIPDVYQIPENAEYSFSKKFDMQNDYRTKSMILVPMKNLQSEVVGVLCLINSLNKNQEIVPFDSRNEQLLTSIASQAMAAIENARLIEKLKNAYLETIFCLSMAAEQKDKDTGAHVRRISEYSKIVGQQLGLDAHQVECLQYASPLHDVGKIGIPDNILQKPGKLTDGEYEVMKQHTVIGARILEGDSEFLVTGREISLAHHEKFNGKGYPHGVKGESIPLFGRIVAVVDVFDALVSVRVYKAGMEPEVAKGMILKDVGEHFCPNTVDAFTKSFDTILEARAELTD